MTGEREVITMLGEYGVNNFTADPASCQELNDLLIRNYPCMREAFCTPFGTTQTAFIVGMTIIGVLIAVIVYTITKKKFEQR